MTYLQVPAIEGWLVDRGVRGRIPSRRLIDD
jgi:hypothetical protein